MKTKNKTKTKKAEPTSLADMLRAWRDRVGLTQSDAASRLGVGLRTYHGWENGEAAWHPTVILIATRSIERDLSEEAA